MAPMPAEPIAMKADRRHSSARTSRLGTPVAAFRRLARIARLTAVKAIAATSRLAIDCQEKRPGAPSSNPVMMPGKSTWYVMIMTLVDVA